MERLMAFISDLVQKWLLPFATYVVFTYNSIFLSVIG